MCIKEGKDDVEQDILFCCLTATEYGVVLDGKMKTTYDFNIDEISYVNVRYL